MWWFLRGLWQDGNGKTCTMLGDIVDHDCRLSENQGMTPQVFGFAELCLVWIRSSMAIRKAERCSSHNGCLLGIIICLFLAQKISTISCLFAKPNVGCVFHI
jgi:hypothetical protein